MALIPEDELEDEDPQVSNIEEMCKSHYGLTPKSYLFIRIATALDTDKTHIPRILDFLTTCPNTRVFVILCMHSSDKDGTVEWVNSTKTKPGRRGLISEVLNECIGVPVLDAIRKLEGDKGLMLLCCGGALARERSRTDMQSNLLRTNTFRFVLGFSTALLFPEHIAHQCQNFFYHCFLWTRSFWTSGPGVPQTRADEARSAAFAWNHTSNSHTGVVLMEKFDDNTISSTEFRMGVPSSKPWGLFMPECPFCKVSFQVLAQHANEETLDLECKCGAKAGSVRPPKEMKKERKTPHYVYSFPCSLKDKITWKLGEKTLTGEWTSTPRSLRD